MAPIRRAIRFIHLGIAIASTCVTRYYEGPNTPHPARGARGTRAARIPHVLLELVREGDDVSQVYELRARRILVSGVGVAHLLERVFVLDIVRVVEPQPRTT